MAGLLQGHTLITLARQIESGMLSVSSIIDACLDQIETHQSKLNAFITVTSDQAREDARVADQEIEAGGYRGPLHGIPISLKDLIDLRGTPTTAASRVREGHTATADAPLVARLRAVGAIIVGKCNLHEFAFGTTSEDSAFGPPRNPHDPERSPGGSSGGSAAAIVADMCLASIGTDTGGSVRIPAAACGTVGLKPTFGELPCEGVVPLSRSLDHVGPLTRSVADAWLLHHVMAGKPIAAIHPRGAARRRPFRLGLLRRYFMDALEDEVREAFERAVARLAQAGVEIEEVNIPHAAEITTTYLHLMLPEAAAYHARTLETRGRDYTDPVRERLEMGRYVLAEDYVRALHGREVLRAEVDAALAGRDGLVLPTLPLTAPRLGTISVQLGERMASVRAAMLRLTQLFNLTGHPAISLPIRRGEMLPAGLQLVGWRDATDELLDLALFSEGVLSENA